MKIEIKRYAFIALLIILSIFGGLVALFTYRDYGYLARGILGFVTLSLLYYFGRYKNLDVSWQALLSDPKKEKYLILAPVVSVISGWAVIQIAAAFLFYLQK